MVSVPNFFAQAMVRLSEQSGATAFETSFQNMQRTVIGRTNDKIDNLQDEFNASSRQRESLVKKANALQDDTTKIQKYLTDNQGNFARLEAIVSKITELQLAFGTDGDTADVTATDIAQFETLRGELATQVTNLHYLSHPDVVKPYAIIHFKEELNAINAMSPTVGASTDTANQEITDYLASLSEQSINAMDATRTAISMSSKLSIRYQGRLADMAAQIQTENTLAQAQLDQDIEDLKVDSANLLQTISLSYDAQAYTTNYLSNALSNGITPPSNSILNIFS